MTGHFCPMGSSQQRACEPGQYQDFEGKAFCKSCPAGKFCPDSSMSEPKSRISTWILQIKFTKRNEFSVWYSV